jgi:hypothetical protein
MVTENHNKNENLQKKKTKNKKKPVSKGVNCQGKSTLGK